MTRENWLLRGAARLVWRYGGECDSAGTVMEWLQSQWVWQYILVRMRQKCDDCRQEARCRIWDTRAEKEKGRRRARHEEQVDNGEVIAQVRSDLSKKTEGLTDLEFWLYFLG